MHEVSLEGETERKMTSCNDYALSRGRETERVEVRWRRGGGAEGEEKVEGERIGRASMTSWYYQTFTASLKKYKKMIILHVHVCTLLMSYKTVRSMRRS